MGYTFIPASKHNPYGYWEDIEFSQLNDYLVRRQCTIDSWYNQLIPLIQRRYTEKRPWGFKDPELVNVIGPYISLFPKAKWVIIIRDRQDTIDSGTRAGWRNNEKVYDGRLKIINDAPLANRLTINFEQAITEPKEVVQQLIQFADLAPTSDQINNAVNCVHTRKESTMKKGAPNSIQGSVEKGRSKAEVNTNPKGLPPHKKTHSKTTKDSITKK